MIPIPKDISEVTPELCRDVFERIAGGKVKRDRYFNNFFVYPDGSVKGMKEKPFNPFTRIQDTKLCDPWLVGNKLRIYINFGPEVKSWQATIRPSGWIWSECRPMLGVDINQSESFVRMCVMIAAFNKLEEK